MPDVEVRAARAEDRAAVVAFCERASVEGDYIAARWDSWLADTEGALLVATDAGRPVAIVHLRMLAQLEGWLEGLRVDQDFRRKGIGERMVAAVLAAAQVREAEAVRLFTSSENTEAQRLFTRHAFEHVATFETYEAEALEGATASAIAAGATLRAARADDRDALWGFLRASNLVPLNGGLVLDGWTARPITSALLRQRLEADDVRMLEEWGTIQAMAIVAQRPRARRAPTLHVQYIDGVAEGIGRLALALREEAAHALLDRVVVSIPDVLILHDAMDGAGYAKSDHSGQGTWCYARRLHVPHS